MIAALGSAISALAKTGPCSAKLSPEGEQALLLLAHAIESCAKTELETDVLKAAKALGA